MSGIAFLFPGQGSQVVGMGQDLCERYDLVRERFEQAEDCLSIPLRRLCFEGPLEELSQTAITQAAVFVHSVATAEVLIENRVQPVCAAGHSLGEYSALTAAGVFNFEIALELVRERGRLMQEAGKRHPGSMTAIIGLEFEVVAQLCLEVAPGGDVVLANLNAPGQLIVSGTIDAVAKLSEAAEAAGAKRVVSLPVSGAFHSKLMASAADEMAGRLADVDMAFPRVPVATNVAAELVKDVDQLRSQLVLQILSPVRWTDCVAAIAAAGFSAAAEVGPGSILKGLVRRIDRSMKVASAGTVSDVEKLITEHAG